MAITAGTMALKKTSETIPFCHAIPIEGSSISIPDESNMLIVRCSVASPARVSKWGDDRSVGSLTDSLTMRRKA